LAQAREIRSKCWFSAGFGFVPPGRERALQTNRRGESWRGAERSAAFCGRPQFSAEFGFVPQGSFCGPRGAGRRVGFVLSFAGRRPNGFDALTGSGRKAWRWSIR
jgi:hypothetical protein